MAKRPSLEYESLITGYQALAVLVAVLYSLAFLTRRQHLAAGRTASSTARAFVAEA